MLYKKSIFVVVESPQLQKIIRTHQSRNLATQRTAADKAKTEWQKFAQKFLPCQ
jgi:hypothetical protein